ncbi:AIR synthase family protein [Clostridia bacterium]|nr:AIR synthase family protein [Clostridia bacterium]
MEVGKLEIEDLKKRIFPYTGEKRKETLIRAMIGEDCSALDLEGDVTVLSTDPITGADEEGGYLSILVSCNDVLSNGAEPVGILLTLLLREGETVEKAEKIMASAHRGAKELHVEIIGGHTEITPGLNQTILSVTAIGRATKKELLHAEDIEFGDGLVLTKGAGIEGTAILCSDYPEQMRKLLGDEQWKKGKDMLQEISVYKEAMLAKQFELHAMHDVTEGGVFGACYEMAVASKSGLTVNTDSIELRPSTKKICESIGLDPYRLISSGSLLIATPQADELVEYLNENQVAATRIGTFHEGKIQIQDAQGLRMMKPPQGDELWRAKELLQG